MYIGKRHQNGVFLIENWHLTDRLVYKSIFQTIIFLLPYVFVRLDLKPQQCDDAKIFNVTQNAERSRSTFIKVLRKVSINMDFAY